MVLSFPLNPDPSIIDTIADCKSRSFCQRNSLTILSCVGIYLHSKTINGKDWATEFIKRRREDVNTVRTSPVQRYNPQQQKFLKPLRPVK